MTKNRLSIHKIGVAATLILFLAAVLCFLKLENSLYLGLRFVSAQKAAEYTIVQEDIGAQILFNNVPAAVDKDTKTIYISQQVDGTTDISQLKGAFSAADSACTLRLAEDENYSNLADAVKSGHRFKLYATTAGKTQEYGVVFTTLPVMNISGVVTGADEEGREIFDGTMGIWDSFDGQTGIYRTQDAQVQWHVRGQTSSAMAKKPWKLSVKNSKGENENISLCGLGSDDDWILNPMNLDDLKIREKLAMELWNSNFAADSEKMSDGRYIELVINGEYKGLYLLQRRLDEKYLELDSGDILLKGAQYVDVMTGDNLEIVSSPYSDEKTAQLLNGIFPEGYIDLMDADNLISNALMIQLGNMFDNLGSKNVYWLVENIEDNCTVKMLLWDTDMSFAIAFNQKFVHALGYSTGQMSFREEWLQRTQKDASLNTAAAQKWFELRKTAFDRDNLVAMTDGYIEQLTQSGALQRDMELWGLYYEGKDSYDSFVKYIDGRLAVLDEYYGQFVQ